MSAPVSAVYTPAAAVGGGVEGCMGSISVAAGVEARSTAVVMV